MREHTLTADMSFGKLQFTCIIFYIHSYDIFHMFVFNCDESRGPWRKLINEVYHITLTAYPLQGGLHVYAYLLLIY